MRIVLPLLTLIAGAVACSPEELKPDGTGGFPPLLGGTGPTGGRASGGSRAGGVTGSGGQTTAGGARARGHDGHGRQRPTIVAATPPMGWNSWNKFACNIDEARIKKRRTPSSSSGMKDVGYQYVNLDDCWMDGRDAAGKISGTPASSRRGCRPRRLRARQGPQVRHLLRPNTKTCEGLYGGPATGGSWEASATRTGRAVVRLLGRGLPQVRQVRRRAQQVRGDARRAPRHRASHRLQHQPVQRQAPACRPAAHLDLLDRPGEHRQHVAHRVRHLGDVGAISRASSTRTSPISAAGPGHWNDPDMLEVGNGAFRTTEQRPLQHVGDHGGAAHHGERPLR